MLVENYVYVDMFWSAVWCNFSFKLKRALLELNHDIVSAGALDVG